MNLQHNSHSNSHQQEPAQETSKASGWHVVGRYRTKTGAVGVEIRVSARSGGFSYIGKWGAGSLSSKASMVEELRSMLARRRGVVVDIPFGGLEVQA